MAGRWRCGGWLALGLGVALLSGCASTPARPTGWRWFAPLPEEDRARVRIATWQARARAAGPPETLGALGATWQAFVSSRRHALLDEVREWIQAEAAERYLADTGVDHWPTFAEALASDGDDCDGLELLVLHALRELGFQDDRLFRAVIERERDGAQHMVTLWFGEPQDPTVIDPTGFATRPLVRMSELAGWRPRAVFDERTAHAVLPASGALATLRSTSPLEPVGASR